jgi:hypothetical protein
MAEEVATLPDESVAAAPDTQKPWEKFAKQKPWKMFSKGPAAAKPTPTITPALKLEQATAVSPLQGLPSEHVDPSMTQADIISGRGGSTESAANVFRAVGATANKAVGYAGNVARGFITDLVNQVSAGPGYAENLDAALRGGEMPVDVLNREMAKEHPNVATAAMTAQGAAGTAPLLLAGGLPALGQRAVALGFSAQMISGVKKLATDYGTELGKAPDQRDQAKLAQLRSDLIQTGVFAPLAGAHGARPGSRSSILPQETITQGAPDASRIASAESVSQPEVRSQVGQETRVRQPGETPGTRQTPPEAQAGAVSLTDLPPPKEGTVRLFSGGDSSFATTNPTRAATYGDVRYVDVPATAANVAREAALKSGAGTPGDHLLPNEWVKKQQPVAVPKSETPDLTQETPPAPPAPTAQAQAIPESPPVTGKVTAENIDSLSPEQQGTLKHGDGIEYGLTLSRKEAGKSGNLQKKYDAAAEEMKQAAQKGDNAGMKAAFGKLNFFGGALMGASRGSHPISGSNYTRFIEQHPGLAPKPAKDIAPSPTPSETAPTGAGQPASIAGEQPAPGAASGPTIKSPLSAFGKAFYKNTEGDWRQKGRPSEKVNASTVDALEQLLKPKAPAQPEIVAMGGDVPHPRAQDFGTTGAPQDIYGVAERVRKARASAGQVAPVPTGQGVSDFEAVKWGQDLERSGADAEKSMQDFERTKAISFDGMALARGHGETLAAVARNAESKFGTDSPGYRAAQKSLSDWDARSKAMQTEWHKIGMAQQGETDIDTGSFTGINRAFRETTGRDLNPSEAKTAKKLATDVNTADAATEPAKANLQTAIDGVSEKGKPVKVAADIESQRKAFQDYKSGKPMTPLQVKTLWTRAKTEYIDKGNDSRPDTIHKLAIDLGLPVKDIVRGLAQTKPVRRAADEVWQRQRQARMLKEGAKSWVNHATETWLQKTLPTVARTLFTLKTGLHGTVALGTHAPLVVATHPIVFKNNFGRMYHLVLSPDYYGMQQHEMARRPNYNVAQRAGLVNDMSKMEDFSDPALAQGFPKMAAWFKAKLDKAHLGRAVGMGTRGYSVLKILRQDLFDNAWNKLAESEKSPELAQAIADSVNHITGVTKTSGGAVGKYAHYALFAPKLEASRVAVIATDPVRAFNSLLKMKNMTEAEKWFATNQFKEKASVFAVFTGLLLANQQLNNLFGDKKKINGIPVALGGGGWNPMQSDFMKFRVAGMTFAWGSPFLTMTRLPLRIYQIGAGTGGKTRFLIYPDESMYKTAGSYLRTQASPFAGPVVSLITKGDYQDRPLPQIPGYGQPPPVPKRLAAEGVKPYTWKEFGTGIVLPIPFEEGASEVFHYYDLGQTAEARNTLLKAFAITVIMAGTGGRVAEDWNKPQQRAPIPWSPPP